MRIFDDFTTDFGKTITLSGKILWCKIFRRGKFSSPSQNFAIFLQGKFLPRYEKSNIRKKITSITKPLEFSKIFVIYKIPDSRI